MLEVRKMIEYFASDVCVVRTILYDYGLYTLPVGFCLGQHMGP